METPVTIDAINARVVPHIIRACVVSLAGLTDDLAAVDRRLDVLGQRQLQLAQLAFGGDQAIGDGHLNTSRNLDRIFSDA